MRLYKFIEANVNALNVSNSLQTYLFLKYSEYPFHSIGKGKRACMKTTMKGQNNNQALKPMIFVKYSL